MQQLQERRVVLISQDSFYRGLTPEEAKGVNEYNFDHPNAMDQDAIVQACPALGSTQGSTKETPPHAPTRAVCAASFEAAEPAAAQPGSRHACPRLSAPAVPDRPEGSQDGPGPHLRLQDPQARARAPTAQAASPPNSAPPHPRAPCTAALRTRRRCCLVTSSSLRASWREGGRRREPLPLGAAPGRAGRPSAQRAGSGEPRRSGPQPPHGRRARRRRWRWRTCGASAT